MLTAPQLSQPNNRLGAAGEQRAIIFLQNKGFQILETNVRLGQFELDIVAFDPQWNEVVFVEVKTRSGDTFGHPSHSVNRRKLLALRKIAVQYLKLRRRSEDFRFDVVTVLPHVVEHFENVTWWL